MLARTKTIIFRSPASLMYFLRSSNLSNYLRFPHLIACKPLPVKYRSLSIQAEPLLSSGVCLVGLPVFRKSSGFLRGVISTLSKRNTQTYRTGFLPVIAALAPAPIAMLPAIAALPSRPNMPAGFTALMLGEIAPITAPLIGF